MSSPNIFTHETHDLVAEAEERLAQDIEEARPYIYRLIGHLTLRCSEPTIQERYAAYSVGGEGFGQYPLAADGFAESFDALYDEEALYEHWNRYGVVVGREVAPQPLCINGIRRIKDIVSDLSDGTCNIDQPDTYDHLPTDANGVPILTRGFFEMYHDDSLAQLRQSLRSYLHHVVLWGRADLWTTFDRLGVKLPDHHESAALPLHVDQNPKDHPDFRTVQGVLALEDCPVERGTLLAVPGSKSFFAEYLPMAPKRGEYVELDTTAPIATDFAEHAQPIPLRQGDIVSWDSRTTHANTANVSRLPRFVAYVAAGPARQDDPGALAARAEAFATGLGSNIRDALMHASKRPRYTDPEAISRVRQPERLTPLGALSYGQERYER
jgi:hypothetical protein